MDEETILFERNGKSTVRIIRKVDGVKIRPLEDEYFEKDVREFCSTPNGFKCVNYSYYINEGGILVDIKFVFEEMDING